MIVNARRYSATPAVKEAHAALTGFVVPREADYDLFDGILAVSREYEGIW
jgi:hypothetical protein